MTAFSASQCTWVEEGGGTAAAQRCLDFLDSVGIEVGQMGDSKEQRLEGLAIVDGRLLIDPKTLVWPSDLLHEGGHIAVAAPEDRPTLGPIEPDGADEMMAMAWSYAASLKCDIGLEELFHSGGYRGDGEMLREAFSSGAYIGAPMLGFYEMTAPAGTPNEPGSGAFPTMSRWLR